MHNKMA